MGYYLYICINMEKILSDSAVKRLERLKLIKKEYKEIRKSGTKKTTAIHKLMADHKASTFTIYKAIKLKEDK